MLPNKIRNFHFNFEEWEAYTFVVLTIFLFPRAQIFLKKFTLPTPTKKSGFYQSLKKQLSQQSRSQGKKQCNTKKLILWAFKEEKKDKYKKKCSYWNLCAAAKSSIPLLIILEK